MSHIAVRTSDAEGWMFVQSTKYGDEDHLRNLIRDEPSLMPMSEMGLPAEATMVPLKETNLPGAGSSDLILIDSLGDIVVVECKLATNPEKKRTVIGQVLDYASSLANLSYDDLDERVAQEHGRSLLVLMEAMVGVEEWDPDKFQKAVENTLKTGRFALVIAIDEMDSNLARILRYVSSQGELRIFGLELRYHKQEDVELIIPHIANPIEVGAARSTAQKVMWDEDAFRAELNKQEDERDREAAFGMMGFIQNESDSFKWGVGKRGSLTFQSTVGRSLVSVFSYHPNGGIVIDLDYLSRKVSPEEVKTFKDSLANIHGFERVRERTNWHEFNTDATVRDESVRMEFKEAVLAFQSSLRI